MTSLPTSAPTGHARLALTKEEKLFPYHPRCQRSGGDFLPRHARESARDSDTFLQCGSSAPSGFSLPGTTGHYSSGLRHWHSLFPVSLPLHDQPGSQVMVPAGQSSLPVDKHRHQSYQLSYQRTIQSQRYRDCCRPESLRIRLMLETTSPASGGLLLSGTVSCTDSLLSALHRNRLNAHHPGHLHNRARGRMQRHRRGQATHSPSYPRYLCLLPSVDGSNQHCRRFPGHADTSGHTTHLQPVLASHPAHSGMGP